MRIFLTLCLAVFSLVLVSCNEVTFQDGRVPEPYRTEFTPYEGNYFGNFAGQDGRLRFEFDGDYALLTFRGHQGLDLLLGCEAFIGRILSAKARGHHGFHGGLSEVVFDFYPGHCAEFVSGREFTLTFESEGLPAMIDARVVRSANELYQGRFRGPYPTR